MKTCLKQLKVRIIFLCKAIRQTQTQNWSTSMTMRARGVMAVDGEIAERCVRCAITHQTVTVICVLTALTNLSAKCQSLSSYRCLCVTVQCLNITISSEKD